MSQDLCFNDVTLSPVAYQNSLWIKASELSRALGYSGEEKVSRLYRRNEDEFTSDMTQVVEIGTEAHFGTGRMRIFSLRGCHLIAMFARTPVAKSFRRWVLDVLEKYGDRVQPQPEQPTAPLLTSPDQTLTPDQQCTLQAIVKTKVEAIPKEQRNGSLYPQVWSRFNNHFRIAKYCQLPQSRMSEAIAYLIGMEIKEVKRALPSPDQMKEVEEECLALIRDIEEAQRATRLRFVALNDRFATLAHRLGFEVQRAAHMGDKTALPDALYHMGYESLSSTLASKIDGLSVSSNPGYLLLGILRQLKGVRS